MGEKGVELMGRWSRAEPRWQRKRDHAKGLGAAQPGSWPNAPIILFLTTGQLKTQQVSSSLSAGFEINHKQ
jgi:hypothetical protein